MPAPTAIGKKAGSRRPKYGAGLICPDPKYPFVVRIQRKRFSIPEFGERMAVADEHGSHFAMQTVPHDMCRHLAAQIGIRRTGCYYWARYNPARTLWEFNMEKGPVLPWREWNSWPKK